MILSEPQTTKNMPTEAGSIMRNIYIDCGELPPRELLTKLHAANFRFYVNDKNAHAFKETGIDFTNCPRKIALLSLLVPPPPSNEDESEEKSEKGPHHIDFDVMYVSFEGIGVQLTEENIDDILGRGIIVLAGAIRRTRVALITEVSDAEDFLSAYRTECKGVLNLPKLSAVDEGALRHFMILGLHTLALKLLTHLTFRKL